MATKVKTTVEVNIAPSIPHTPQKATEAVRTKRARSPPLMKSEGMEKGPSDYEKYREERIKANMERMQKLGLLDLSRDVKSVFHTPNLSTLHKRRVILPSDGSKKKIDLYPPLPPRRSSRFVFRCILADLRLSSSNPWMID
jgi:cell division cycle-associated protein 7